MLHYSAFSLTHIHTKCLRVSVTYQKAGFLPYIPDKLIALISGQHLLPYINVRPHPSAITTADCRHHNFTMWDHSSPYSTECHLFL